MDTMSLVTENTNNEKNKNRILMRVNMWPEENYTSAQVIAQDSIGSNTGNMLFAQSIARWLKEANSDLIIDNIRDGISDQYADYANKTYDFVVLPFANAFRDDFIPFLKKWTAFIKKLTIPCFVIGIGAQMNLSEKEWKMYPEALDFCNAVLEHSASIGVRGDITKKYLIRLGVPADKIDVIGCPSYFINGMDYQKMQKKPFEEIRKFSFNTSPKSPLIPYIQTCMNQFQNSYFIAQGTWELLLLFTGYLNHTIENEYFVRPESAFYKEGRIVGFTDTASWLNFFAEKEIDLSVGTRLHGNLAACITGTPTMIIAGDTRVKEVVEYFEIPCRTIDTMLDVTPDEIKNWYEEADFNRTEQRYYEVLNIYKAFLDKNQIPYQVPQKRYEYEKPDKKKPVIANHLLEREEILDRQKEFLKYFYDRYKKRVKWDENRISIEQLETAQKKAEIKKLKKQLKNCQTKLDEQQATISSQRDKIAKLTNKSTMRLAKDLIKSIIKK